MDQSKGSLEISRRLYVVMMKGWTLQAAVNTALSILSNAYKCVDGILTTFFKLNVALIINYCYYVRF
jgi:hypothetical protein